MHGQAISEVQCEDANMKITTSYSPPPVPLEDSSMKDGETMKLMKKRLMGSLRELAIACSSKNIDHVAVLCQNYQLDYE